MMQSAPTVILTLICLHKSAYETTFANVLLLHRAPYRKFSLSPYFANTTTSRYLFSASDVGFGIVVL